MFKAQPKKSTLIEEISDYCENLKRAIHFMNLYTEDIPSVFTKEEIAQKLKKIEAVEGKLNNVANSEPKASRWAQQLQEGKKMFYLYGVQLDVAATQVQDKKKERTLGELVLDKNKSYYLL